MSGSRPRPWLIAGLVVLLLGVVLAPVGCAGFTLYSWIVKGKDPSAVLADWKRERRLAWVEARGQTIMERIRADCPERMEGWNPIPYRNDLAGQYYELLHPVQLQYHYRRPDGSDDLALTVIVNPSVEGLLWFEANPVLPDSARPLEAGPGVQAWIHEAYPWNFFLPPYDRKPGAPKACMAQVFVGDWGMRPFLPEERSLLEAKDRRVAASFLSVEEHPDWAGPEGRIDPGRIPAEALCPIFQVPSSRQMLPLGHPDIARGPVHPRCIALEIIGRDETSVRGMLARMNLKDLARLTQGD